MLRSFFLFAWRNLRKNRVYSAINVLGLASGMAVALLIGLWMYDELTFDHSFEHHRTIVQVMSTTSVNGELRTGKATLLPVAEQMAGSDFEAVSLASWNQNWILSHGEKKISSDGMFVQPAFADIFSLKMLEGSRDGLKDPSSILLNASTARALFGSEDPLGKTVKVSADFDMKVAGVFEDFPENTSLTRTRLLMPWDKFKAFNAHWYPRWEKQWDNHSFQIYAQLNPHAGLRRVEQRLTAMVRTHPESARESILLNPMDRWRLYSDFKNGVSVGGHIQFVWMFGIIGAFVLFLACINFMNLSTARSEKRAREVGIRKTLGSLRGQLMLQLYVESNLVALLSLAIALWLAWLALPFFNGIADKHMGIPVADGGFWALSLGFTLLTGLLSGSYPALYLSSFQPIRVLKGAFKAGRFASLPRRVLVVLQFTVSVALIIGTIVVFRQVQFAKDRPVGYDREGLIVVKVNTPDLAGHYDVLRADLLATGAVADMAESNSPTTKVVSTQTGYTWEGISPDARPEFAYVSVTHDYGKTVQWQVKEGRDFSRAFTTDTGGIILNESAARLMGVEHPVGKTLHDIDHAPHVVVGVVRDMIMESPYTPVSPTLYTLDYSWTESILLRVAPGQPVDKALREVAPVFAKYNPGAPFEYTFADAEYAYKFSDEDRVGRLAGIFALLAILISCLGLFGLAGFVAEQRTKEVGVRKVLGATVFHIWRLLSTEFFLLVLVSCGIAAPVAWYYLHQWLGKYAYHTPISPWIFAAAGGGALVITLATVSFQSIRAALANPVKSLRSE